MSKDLAIQIARQLHAQDELNIDQDALPKPVQAIVATASAFAIGTSVPIEASLLSGGKSGGMIIVFLSIVALGISGSVGACIGVGKKVFAALRVLGGGVIAMIVTHTIGLLIGHSV